MPPPEVDVQAVTDGVVAEFIAGGTRQVLSLNVRLVGPDRFVFEQKVENSVLQWIPPGDLADGYYHWEAWVVSAGAGAPKGAGSDYEADQVSRQIHLATGSFRVENGLLAGQEPGVTNRTKARPCPHASPSPSWTSWSRRLMHP